MSGFYVNGTNISTLFKTGTNTVGADGGFKINGQDITYNLKGLESSNVPITYFKKMNLDLNTIFMDINANQITDNTNISNTNATAFSYISMPGGSRTLLNYITSFTFNGTPVTGTSANNGTGLWNTSFSGNITYTDSPIATIAYFTQYNRVRIINGDGENNANDWSVFNFGPDFAGGDHSGTAAINAYFGGEGNNAAGKGGFSNITIGYIWGFSTSSGWIMLYQIPITGTSAYNHVNGKWFELGSTVASGSGKRTAYDNLSITHLGFSVT